MADGLKFITDNFVDFKEKITHFNYKYDTEPKDIIDLTKLIINDYVLKSSSGATDLYIYKTASYSNVV